MFVGVKVGVGDGELVGVGDGVFVGVGDGELVGVGDGVLVSGDAVAVAVPVTPVQPRSACLSGPCAELSFAFWAPLLEAGLGQPPLSALVIIAPEAATVARTQTTRTMTKPRVIFRMTTIPPS